MAKDKPELSIIIISFNTREITKNCLNSIRKPFKNSLSYEIIVIDNASTDGSLKMLNEIKDERLRIIKNGHNEGFGKANNQGAKMAQGTYLFFLNSDTVVLDNAVSKLLTCFKENENKIHIMGGKLFNTDMSPQPSCGPFYSLPVVFAALFLRGDYYGLTRYSPDGPKKVDWVSGACILTKKEYFEQVGGFDEGIHMYMEEIDLLYRAKKYGFQTYFCPSAHFIHLGSASSGGRTFPILQVYRGFIYFYQKHYSSLSLFFLRLMLQLKAAIAVLIGRISNNHYLVTTYEQAFQIASQPR